MSKRPMYLQHVNIYVRNAERSKQWYEDLLGLHTYEYRPGWAAFMSADEEQSHRGVAPGKPRLTNPDSAQRGEPHDQQHQPEDSKHHTRLDESDRETADQGVG